MNFENLNRYTVLVKHMSFSRAADELFLSQPALSMQLKKLEEEVGCRLISRDTHGLVLTEKGRVFYEYALRILGEYAELVKKLSGKTADALRVGYITEGHSEILAATLAHAYADADRSKILLRIGTPHEMRALFRKGELDCVMCHRISAQSLSDIAQIRKLKSCKLIAAMRDDAPLAKKGRATLKELSAMPWVFWERENAEYAYDFNIELFRQAKAMPEVIYDKMHHECSRMLVKAYNGFSLVSDIEFHDAGFAHVDIGLQTDAYELVFLTHKEAVNPSAEKLYFAVLSELLDGNKRSL